MLGAQIELAEIAEGVSGKDVCTSVVKIDPDFIEITRREQVASDLDLRGMYRSIAWCLNPGLSEARTFVSLMTSELQSRGQLRGTRPKWKGTTPGHLADFDNEPR